MEGNNNNNSHNDNDNDNDGDSDNDNDSDNDGDSDNDNDSDSDNHDNHDNHDCLVKTLFKQNVVVIMIRYEQEKPLKYWQILSETKISHGSTTTSVVSQRSSGSPRDMICKELGQEPCECVVDPGLD